MIDHVLLLPPARASRLSLSDQVGVETRDDNLGMGTRYLAGTSTGMILYLRVAPVPDPNRNGYGTCIFSHPRVTRRVSDTLLLL
jgi:hypothetical protein